MDKTLRNIIDIVEQIAQQHRMINDYSGGDLSEIGTKVSTVDLKEERNEMLYPYLWWDFGNTNYSLTSGSRGIAYKVYTLSITVMDKIIANANLTKDVMSENEAILSDVIQSLSTNPALKQFRLELQNMTVTPVRDEEKEGAEGWTVNLPFKIPYTYCYTNLPIEGIQTVEPSCQGVDIFINGIFSETIPSGGRYDVDCTPPSNIQLITVIDEVENIPPSNIELITVTDIIDSANPSNIELITIVNE